MLVRLNKKLLDRGEYVEGAVNAKRDRVPGEAAKKGFRFLYSVLMKNLIVHWISYVVSGGATCLHFTY